MTYKHIEASREIRLWIGQVIVPAVTCGIALMTIPEIRWRVQDKISNIKSRIRRAK